MERSYASLFLIPALCLILTANTYTAAALDTAPSAAATATPDMPPIYNRLHTNYTSAEKAILLALAKAASIRGQHFYLSDLKIIAALKEIVVAKKEMLSLRLNESNKGHKQLASELPNTKLIHDTHAKIWSIRPSGTPATPPKKKKAPSLRYHDSLFIGSANASGAAHRNFEIVYETNDPELCAQFAALHDDPPRTPSKKERTQLPTLESTPPRKRLLHSYTTKLNPSRANRIETAITQKKADPDLAISIAMCTMNINDQDTLETLAEAASCGVDVTLYLDKDALSETKKAVSAKASIDKIALLQACSDAGVNIFVFDPYHTGGAIMHSKLLLRTIGSEQYLEVSTANATGEGERQRNASVVDPNPEDHVVAGCEEHMAAVEKASVPFKDIDLKKSQDARKKRKQKPEQTADDENTKPTNTKKKLKFT